jgi:threonylcarbamoyladenosine tRNA methylthiotransferase MtaB
MPRIRLSSLEIMEIDDQMLEIIEDKRVCKHLHIPLQSGDDTILKKMNRTYSSSDFKKKVDRIIDKYPYISIGSDVIVGFPGEGEAEFNNTRELLINHGISYFHVFPYSKRKNTPASSFSEQIDKKIKNERVQLLRSLSEEKMSEYMSSFVGSKLDVIVEDKNSDNTFNSTSGNYLKVRLHSSGLKQGSLIDAHIKGVVNGRLAGIPINES